MDFFLVSAKETIYIDIDIDIFLNKKIKTWM